VETIAVSGPATVAVYFEGGVLGSANDDGSAPGLDEVRTQMIDLNLHGFSPVLGPIEIRLNPHIPTMGEIEEMANNTPGVLDLPPFGTPGKTATSFFDVYFEVTVLGRIFHTIRPKHMTSVIRYKPPAPGDIYESPEELELFDESGSPTGYFLSAARHQPNPARIVRASPEDEHSLWRSQHNIVRLWFSGDLLLPMTPGQILIREMLPGAVFGPDLSSQFSFTVENDGGGHPRILRIWENGSTLSHRHWYSIANTGGWISVLPFELQYVVQVGDASDDARVLAYDVSVINTGIPTFAAPDDERRDINGDGRILAFDVSVTNSSIPSFPVPKPSGHP
jgi:hypothetical protein